MVSPTCATAGPSLARWMDRIGHVTSIDASALPPVPLLNVTEAVLGTVEPHSAAVVGEVTCSVIVAPATKVKVPVVAGSVPQLKVWVGGDPFTAQAMPEGMDVPVPESDQLIPVPAGKESESVTPVASPAPELCSVTTYPIGCPAFTVAWSAVLVSTRVGQLIVMLMGPTEGEPSLLEVAEAVLWS